MVLFFTRVWLRSFDYRNDIVLATHDLTVTPPSFSLDSVLSHAYIENGQYKKGLFYAQKSVQLFPYIQNYNNLGTAYGNLGDYKDAKNAYINALKYGDYYLTYENLATIALVYGNRTKNITYIKTVALRKYPTDAKMWQCLAGLEYVNGNKVAARIAIAQAYLLLPNAQIASAYFIIMNNKSLHLSIRK